MFSNDPALRRAAPQMTTQALAFRHRHIVERVDWQAVFSKMPALEGWEVSFSRTRPVVWMAG